MATITDSMIQSLKASGYKLPHMWSWSDVRANQREYEIPANYVPLAVESGQAVAWGTYVPTNPKQ